MMLIGRYEMPQSVEAAYQLLNENSSSLIIGGGVFLRLGSREVDLAVDLSRAGIDFIEEKDDTIEIGAMATLRSVETSPVIRKYYGDLFTKTLKHIVAVQLRNIATVGGSVFGRYGFSDILTTLMVLDCNVVFHKSGEMSLADFMAGKRPKGDILTKIILRKEVTKASFQTMRNTQNDFPMLNVAAAMVDGVVTVSVGARPAVTEVSAAANALLAGGNITEELALKAGEAAAEELKFSDDVRASGEYRQMITPVLVKRAIMEVIG